MQAVANLPTGQRLTSTCAQALRKSLIRGPNLRGDNKNPVSFRHLEDDFVVVACRLSMYSCQVLEPYFNDRNIPKSDSRILVKKSEYFDEEFCSAEAIPHANVAFDIVYCLHQRDCKISRNVASSIYLMKIVVLVSQEKF